MTSIFLCYSLEKKIQRDESKEGRRKLYLEEKEKKGGKEKEKEKRRENVYNLHNQLPLRPSLPSRQPPHNTLFESRD